MANSPILAIPLLTANQSNKETTINDAISFLEKAIAASQPVNLAAGDVALTDLDVQRFFLLKPTGATAARSITIPTTINKIFAIDNTDSTFSVSIVRGAVTVLIPAGTIAMLYADQTGLVSMASGSGGAGGVSKFTDLLDTPNAYTGQAGKVLAVKADLSGLEFVAASGGGSGGIAEAPADGKQYGRQNSAWTEIVSGGGSGGGAGYKGQYSSGAGFNVEGGTIPSYLTWTAIIGNVYANNNPGTVVDKPDSAGATLKAIKFPANGGLSQTYLEWTVNLTSAGVLRTRYSVDSEANFDFFEIYVNGTVVPTARAAGKVGPAEFVVNLSAGQNVIRFSYKKDNGGDGGEDTAWIHSVSLTGGGLSGPVYAAGDTVLWNGSIWLCLTAGTSAAPGTTADWAKVSDIVKLRSFSTAADAPTISDANKLIVSTGSSAATATIPANSGAPFQIGDVLTFMQTGTGTLTIAGASGVTISVPAGFGRAIRAQYATVSAVKVAADTWVLTGALAAA